MPSRNHEGYLFIKNTPGRKTLDKKINKGLCIQLIHNKNGLPRSQFSDQKELALSKYELQDKNTPYAAIHSWKIHAWERNYMSLPSHTPYLRNNFQDISHEGRPRSSFDILRPPSKMPISILPSYRKNSAPYFPHQDHSWPTSMIIV